MVQSSVVSSSCEILCTCTHRLPASSHYSVRLLSIHFSFHQLISILLLQEVDTYFYDPNYDQEDFAFEDESPYPEVRSAVANTDDPSMPASTLRAWVMGLLWAVVLPSINQFFWFRYPAVEVTGIVAQLVSYPLGRALAAYTPNWRILGTELNPGPFTIKEHVLITVRSERFCRPNGD